MISASYKTAACALLLLLVYPAAGQGTREDYLRANSMEHRVRGLVLNERLDATWVSDAQLVYRRQTGVDAWRFVTIDVEGCKRREVFDHEQVAKLASSVLGREVGPDRIPIERFAVCNEKLVGVLDDGLHAVQCSPDGGEVSLVKIEDVGAFRLPSTRLRKSYDEGGWASVLFVNRWDAPVELFWLDRSGKRVSYGTIEPGGRHQQGTYAGHVWLVAGPDEACLGVYKSTPGFSVVLIDGQDEILEPYHLKRPAVSPDGRSEVVVREHNLFLRDVDSGEIVPLSTNGTAENEYTPEVYWSSDSKRLVAVRQEPEQVHTVYLIESSPADQLQPKLHSDQYLKPGDRIAVPHVVLFDVGERAGIPLDDALFDTAWSLSKFKWSPDNSGFSFLYNRRGHQLQRVIHCDAATGDLRTVVEERSDTFIDYSNKTFLHRLPETNELIWTSERSGWNHLYLFDAAGGKVKNPITSGEWLVRGVEHVDPEKRQIWFRAVGVYPEQDPYHVHYGRVNFDGTDLTWLTEGDGMHSVRYSPDRRYFIDTWSRVDQPPVFELRRAEDGELLCELERADWDALLATGWRVPERFVAKGRDGETDIWGVIFTPSTFDPDQQYPVIEKIYAGPHDHFVPKSFAAWHGSRKIAELGFVVVQIDGMGTNWRSRAFHDVCWKNIGDSGFPDRIRWIKAAAAGRAYMGLGRVGIYGGSAGGQSALRAMLAHGDFYRAAVADCGCHDNRMDKIWWNEAWMGWPVGPHYEEQSNVTNAHRLQGDLLLIVGELDRNVPPTSTLQVVDALIKADKDFDLLVMPGVGHGSAETPYGQRRRQDFFVRHLLGVEPRRNGGETLKR